uniref:DNA polymerase delta subunit 3 n=1 Tax=Mus musculus TaxID=10090 RepID=A0A140LHJ0_MOUSE
MLYEYVERKRKENSGAQLHVTYLVSGSLIQNGHSCHKVAVVREDKLEGLVPYSVQLQSPELLQNPHLPESMNSQIFRQRVRHKPVS